MNEPSALLLYAGYLKERHDLLAQLQREPVDAAGVLREAAAQGCLVMTHYVHDPATTTYLAISVLGLTRAAVRGEPALPALVQARNRVLHEARSRGEQVQAVAMAQLPRPPEPVDAALLKRVRAGLPCGAAAA